LEGEARGDGRVESVPALLEHRHARRRREPVRRGDDAEGSAKLWAGRDAHAVFAETISAVYSGTSQTTPSGGSVRSAEKGWSCHGTASASTPPMLPTPEPP